jgi:hypothetical protein
MPDQAFLAAMRGSGTRSRDPSMPMRLLLPANRAQQLPGRKCGESQRRGWRACGAGQRRSGPWVRVGGGAGLRCRSAEVLALGCGRRCGFAMRVSGGAGSQCAGQRRCGLAVRGSGEVEAPGSGPATARLSGSGRVCSAGVGHRGRLREVQGRRGNRPDRSGQGGRAGPNTTPPLSVFDRLFNGAICVRLGTRALLSDRSFSGGNLRAPLYKGPLVQ